MKQPSRQVHLDFHTSEHIDRVGADFDEKQFQEALRVGRVNSINVFAKCHHGWSYYPTKVGNPHPRLATDLLGRQIAACHDMGVRAPIYYTVGLAANDAVEHPEWIVRRKDGSLATCDVDVNARPDDPRPYGSWIHLCPSGGYLDLMLRQTEEICRTFNVDGFWYDICFLSGGCWCDTCRAGMKAAGVDLDSDAEAEAYNVRKWHDFMHATRRIILAGFPNASIFYNGASSPYTQHRHPACTYFDLEDLPSSWGGYDRLPPRAKFFATTGKDYVAMSGKFHTEWGEFGGFKHRDAMRHEAATMLAFGARCCFGDQLHPTGRMDMATYAGIGHAYEYVEKMEEFGLDGEQCSRLGLVLTGSESDDQGVANMLMETQTDFEVAALDRPLARFSTVILAGGRFLDETAAAALSAYVAGGGSLLIVGESGLLKGDDRFALDVGAEYVGPAAVEDDYTVTGDELAEDVVRSPFLNQHAAAFRAKLSGGQELAGVHEAYFNRTYARYCSHRNTPPRPERAAHPAAWRKGRVVYLAHRLGDVYYRRGSRIHRQFFRNALGLLYRDPVLTASLPSAGRVNLIHQRDLRRYVVHLLYAPPHKRGEFTVLEDMPPLHDVTVTLAVPEKVKRVRLATTGAKLGVKRDGGRITVVVPVMTGHEALVAEY